MAEQKVLKPNPEIEGGLVRDENRIPLPTKGRVVTMSPYWERRLREGDVVEVKGQAPQVEVEVKPEAEKKGGNK